MWGGVTPLKYFDICQRVGEKSRPVPTGGVGVSHPPRHNFCRHRTKSGISVSKQANVSFTSVKYKSFRVCRQKAILSYN